MATRSVKISTAHDTKMSGAIGGFLGYMGKHSGISRVTGVGKNKRR